MADAPKFIQIAFGASCCGADLYALDEAGKVWKQTTRADDYTQIFGGRMSGWEPMPERRFTTNPAHSGASLAPTTEREAQ